MLAGKELLALLFYLAGGVIRGAARLQKMVFLVQKELGIGGFKFTASKYGPWSKELEELVLELAKRGEVTIEEHVTSELQEQPAKVYRANEPFIEQGREIFKSLLRSNPAFALMLHKKVRVYATLPITYLLAYVYKKYPEYTVQSIIMERVRKWQKHYKLRMKW